MNCESSCQTNSELILSGIDALRIFDITTKFGASLLTWVSVVSESKSRKLVEFKPEFHDNTALQGAVDLTVNCICHG